MSEDYGAPYQPPLNAPLTGIDQLGITPGTQPGLVIAQQVVILGTKDGLFIYNGSPALGNLIGSWTGAPGTDPFGNTYAAGLTATQGTLNGMAITASTILNSYLTACTLATPNIQTPTISGGTATETVITFDSGGGSLVAYAVTTTTVTQTTNGAFSFTVPAGVLSGDVTTWGAGAGGDGGSNTLGGIGGGAGECAREPNYPMTPGAVLSGNVGNGGAGSGTGGGQGTDGGDTYFDLANGGVYAHGGKANGAGGTGSTNTSHHDGGAGGTATSSGGGGGGGSAGQTGNGGAGGNSTTSTGGTGGAAGTGGGAAGGAGGNNAANGVNGSAPGAGGGGAGKGSGTTSFSKTYTCTATHTYQGSDGTNANQKINDNGTSYQGGDKANTYNGKAKTWIVFNASQIQSDLASVSLTSTKLTLNNNHTWYNSGMTIAVGWDTKSSFGSTASDPSGANIDAQEYHVNEGSTITQGIGGLGTAFKNGTATNVVLFKNSNNLNYYGYFAGENQSGPPALQFNGNIGGTATTAGAGQDGKIQIVYTSAALPIASFSPVAFTDKYGNSILKGIATAIGNVDSGAVDLTNRTVTQATTTQLGSIFTIPSNDALVGTTYEYEAWGNGTWGSTQQQLNINPMLNGASTAGHGAANTTFPISTVFNWKVTINWYVTATGVSGNVNQEIFWPLSANTVATQLGTPILRNTTVNTFNTTASQTLGLNANWAATTGAPTLTCLGSRLTRKGPQG